MSNFDLVRIEPVSTKFSAKARRPKRIHLKFFDCSMRCMNAFIDDSPCDSSTVRYFAQKSSSRIIASASCMVFALPRNSFEGSSSKA